MELKTNRPRLNIADTGEEQSRQHLAVRKAAMDAGSDFLEQPFPRSVFEQPHQRLDLGIESDNSRRHRRFRRRNSRQPRKEAEIAQTKAGGGSPCGL